MFRIPPEGLPVLCVPDSNKKAAHNVDKERHWASLDQSSPHARGRCSHFPVLAQCLIERCRKRPRNKISLLKPEIRHQPRIQPKFTTRFLSFWKCKYSGGEYRWVPHLRLANFLILHRVTDKRTVSSASGQGVQKTSACLPLFPDLAGWGSAVPLQSDSPLL